jgi:DNA-binding MarR family transcriptional regulator
MNKKDTQNSTERFLKAINQITKIFAHIECCREDPTLTKLDLLALSVLFNQKELTMSQLTENMGISMSRTTGVVDKLVEKKLTKRVRNHEDRRIVKVTLTEKGKEITKSHQKQTAEVIKQVLNVLTMEEQRILISILEKISKKLNEAMI